MINKYPFFKYVVGNSSFHLMNSKLKILWSLLMIFTVIILNDFLSSIILILYLFFIILRTNIKLNGYIDNILMIWPLYLISFILVFLLTLNFKISLLISIKALYIVLTLLIVTFTTSLSEIAWGFECLFEKLKKIHIPVSKISLKIALYIKFISTVFEQFKTVRRTISYRGVPYKRLNIIKSFKLMIMPSIILSYKLSSRMISAMKLRFYGNCKRRTNYHENKVRKSDKFLIFCNLIIIYIVIWLGWII